MPESRTVDLKRLAVAVCALLRGRYDCLVHLDGVVRSTILPGLAIDVAALFAGL